MPRLQDKVAIITGGSRGIGEAIAIRAAQDGANVAINYHSSSAGADSAVEEIKAMGGETYEDTIVEALDALDSEEFWAEADRAVAWRRSQDPQRRRRMAEREAAVDAVFDAIS